MAKLIVISGDERQEFELAPFNTLGRHPDNTIQILDRIISKEHAHIQRSGDGRFLLRDLRSLNGTSARRINCSSRLKASAVAKRSVGSFASAFSTAVFKAWKIVKDEWIPGTLNIGHTLLPR